MKFSNAIRNVERVFMNLLDIASEEYIDSFEIMVEAMKKQMPMKPVIEQGAPSYYGGTSICRHYYSCPKCGEEVGRGDDKANYCHDCGQAIDWTED